MADWRDLQRELEAWIKAGRCATFWWRDDDAVTMTPELQRLCAIAEDTEARVSIAVIPAMLDDSLLYSSDWPDGTALLQHGYAHRNHAPPDRKKAECRIDRPTDKVIDELRSGWNVLRKSMSAVAAFVPPWNRIDDAVAKRLPEAGLRGLSTFGPRAQRNPLAGLIQANTHIDPVHWHGGRSFIGEDAAITQAIAHLSKRRAGTADPDEPTGLLTHHQVHDIACWRFVETLARLVTAHQGACWLSAEEVFAP